jgi:hypothetical protein
MSVQAIAWALSVKTKSPSAKLVLVTIANYCDESGFCWPSQELIARQSEQSIDSVQRRLQELVKAGFILRKVRRRKSSLYQLLMPEIKKPQTAVLNDRNEIKKPQNPFLKPQLCGTEPLILPTSSKKDIKVLPGKGKPRHGIKTRDLKRIWFDRDSDEWMQYAQDYRDAHSGLDPPLQWNGGGTWFNLLGEQT